MKSLALRLHFRIAEGIFLGFIASAVLLSTSVARGVECPAWIQQNRRELPECPDSSVVPETFPVGAVVVSDQRGRKDDGALDPQFTADVVMKTLHAAGEKTPLILLPVTGPTYSKIVSQIATAKVSPKEKIRWMNSIKRVPSSSYTWQQDYFESFVDPKTGQVTLREVSKYLGERKLKGVSFDRLADAASTCGFAKGPELETEWIHYKIKDEKTGEEKAGQYLAGGYYGGNIEALPGGICLLGSDGFNNEMWQKYGNQFCSGSRIGVPTSWLVVGHSDEVIKTVKNPTRPAPCDFSVAIASPDKALELMQANPDAQFAEFQPRASEALEEMEIRRNKTYKGLRSVCRAFKALSSSPQEQKTPAKGRGAVTWLDLRISLFPAAFADFQQPSQEDDFDPVCAKLTNAQVLRVMKEDATLRDYNLLVQQEMAKLRRSVTLALKDKFPNCKADIIDFPDLFFGGEVVKNKDGTRELPRAMGRSILPNPTNSISIGETVISPEPANAAFRKYMTDEYTKRGLKAEFVDTFDYAHMGSGNLHCSSHTIHMCQPKDAK